MAKQHSGERLIWEASERKERVAEQDNTEADTEADSAWCK
jgi:hypothetical protein